MSTLASFLHQVLHTGRISLHTSPDADETGAREVLCKAYTAHALTIAGPLPAFDEKTALAAGRVLLHAAWYFLNPGLLIEAPEKTLRLPAPTRPEQQLSADLVLRYLPTLHRRAKTLAQNDALPGHLEHLLRQWPLSGVLADIVEPPLTPIDFGDHAGLYLLYAERLAEHERPGWFPTGRGMQYIELVWQQLGKNVSVLSALEDVARELRQQGPQESLPS